VRIELCLGLDLAVCLLVYAAPGLPLVGRARTGKGVKASNQKPGRGTRGPFDEPCAISNIRQLHQFPLQLVTVTNNQDDMFPRDLIMKLLKHFLIAPISWNRTLLFSRGGMNI
jgi:hypothetical protein